MLTTKDYNPGGNKKGQKVEETAAFLFKNGMNPEVINRLIRSKPNLLDSNLANVRELYSVILSNGFKSEQISAIITETPELLIMNPTDIKKFIKSCKEFKIEQDQIKAVFIYSPPHMMHLMRFIGMETNDITSAIKNSDILLYYHESIWSSIDMLKELKVESDDIKEFVKNKYKKLGFNSENGKKVFHTLRIMELSNSEISNVLMKQPFVFYYNSENMRGIFDALVDSGAEFEDITRLFTTHPEIMDCKLENIILIRNFMNSLGDKNGLVDILEKDPSILVNINENNINKVAGTLLKNGFSLRDVNNILKELPNILLECNKEKLDEIIEVVRIFTHGEKDMVKVFVNNPALLLSDQKRVMLNLQLLSSFNFDSSNFKEILSKSDFLISDAENNKKILGLLTELGLQQEQIIKLMQYSNIFFIPFENLEHSIGMLMMNGYSKLEVVKNIIDKPDAFFNVLYKDMKRTSEDDINGPE